MIDIENKVFTTVYEAVTAEFPDADVVSEGVFSSPKFPLVTLIQEENTTLARTQDDALTEHHATVMFECNVYSNDKRRKSTCKAIAQIVDNTMQNMKFTRSFMGQTPNEDQTIYRMTLRYTAVVGEGVESGDDTVYQIYRH